MKHILAFIFGSIFSLGLIISGMSNPENVLNFLDLFGNWDPSLALVMIGAIAIAFIPFQKVVRNPQAKSLLGDAIQLPQQQKIDARLITGSALFGIGWGLAGICPAPSLTLIGLGHFEALYFIVSMFIGVLLFKVLNGAK